MTPLGHTVERMIREDTPTINEAMLRSVLGMFLELGCVAEVPEAQRRDYVNVLPPLGHGTYRLGSVNNTSTTRVEFQRDSFDLAEAAALVPPFEHLDDANKAALTPTSDADVDSIRQLTLVIPPTLRAT